MQAICLRSEDDLKNIYQHLYEEYLEFVRLRGRVLAYHIDQVFLGKYNSVELFNTMADLYEDGLIRLEPQPDGVMVVIWTGG